MQTRESEHQRIKRRCRGAQGMGPERWTWKACRGPGPRTEPQPAYACVITSRWQAIVGQNDYDTDGRGTTVPPPNTTECNLLLLTAGRQRRSCSVECDQRVLTAQAPLHSMNSLWRKRRSTDLLRGGEGGREGQPPRGSGGEGVLTPEAQRPVQLASWRPPRVEQQPHASRVLILQPCTPQNKAHAHNGQHPQLGGRGPPCEVGTPALEVIQGAQLQASAR